MEHLLVMPLEPFELMFAKIWANGLVVVVAAMASLFLVVKGALGVPITGSITLFARRPLIYLFSVTALGIMLATVVRSMPQFGLLAFPVFIVMSLLSGGQTPLESMPMPCRRSCSSCRRRISSAFRRRCCSGTRLWQWCGRTGEDAPDRVGLHGVHAFPVPQDAGCNSIKGVAGE